MNSRQPSAGPVATSVFAYVGSRTTRERKARGEGITVFRHDRTRSDLTRVQVVGDLVNPSYLALNARGTRLYVVHGDLDYASAFAVDQETGALQFINRQSTGGDNPVHLTIDPAGGHLVVANHRGGSLAVLPIGAHGELQPLSQLVALEGAVGPHRVEQTQAKPHFNDFDPSGRYVVVPDKGLDRVFTFRFEDGRLSPAARPSVATRECAGPRHQVFDPHLPVVYVANELDATVTSYRFDADSGGLEPLQRLSTLPASFCGDSRAAAIAINATGRTLYVSNRGHESIAVIRLDARTGAMRLVDATPSGGAKPRFFTLSPQGDRLFALNEDSHTIVPFAVDPETGALSRSGTAIPCGSPVCMVFSRPAAPAA